MDSIKAPRFILAVLFMIIMAAACFTDKVSGETMVGTLAGLVTGAGAVFRRNGNGDEK